MDPAERADAEQYLAEEHRRQERLSVQVGADPVEVARTRELIASWDALSLALYAVLASAPVVALRFDLSPAG